MKCSKCGFENDDNRKFCNQCGNSLSTVSDIKLVKKKKIVKIVIILFLIIAVLFGAVEGYIQLFYGNKATRETMNSLNDSIADFQDKLDKAGQDISTTSSETNEFTLYELYDEVSYDELVSGEYTLVKVTGTVSNVLYQDDDFYEFFINLDGKVIYIDYINSYDDIKLEEGKKVTIYGSYRGMEENHSLNGDVVNSLEIFASYVE